ncbi:hypothetical protein [Streptomyces sp. HUAS TT20]|uniref:hypothetical protein n=1 Tax=Streptomyces sp. HUAS TT20 TaxID=3447509 RepID=UPI0021DAC4CF|nr:hypothetical protein [Streptomyces sp. HUAS 15-9]UXY28853.1 hypothetical protein N8I87_21415 [Streptomyces sp. HUAS 15-9]
MGSYGGGQGGDDAERLAHLLGGLLIELGEKVREAGPEAVRILTDDEVQRTNLQWYRTGWEEHARAVRSSGRPVPPTRSPEPARPPVVPIRAPDPARPSGHPADPDTLSSAGRPLRLPEHAADRPGHDPSARPR